MRTTIMVAAAWTVLSLYATSASAQNRFDVGLLLGSTQVTDEGAVLQFDRGTTYQAKRSRVLPARTHADLNNVRWVSHCRDLVQLPVAA